MILPSQPDTRRRLPGKHGQEMPSLFRRRNAAGVHRAGPSDGCSRRGAFRLPVRARSNARRPAPVGALSQNPPFCWWVGWFVGVVGYSGRWGWVGCPVLGGLGGNVGVLGVRWLVRGWPGVVWACVFRVGCSPAGRMGVSRVGAGRVGWRVRSGRRGPRAIGRGGVTGSGLRG